MKATATVTDTDKGMADLYRRIRAQADHVDIGIHADAGQKLVTIAAAHEYGATINHPGGTAYGYATAEDAKRHRITFLKAGSGYKILGVTKPHVITIPMRSFIRSTMDEKSEEYHRKAGILIGRIVDGSMDKHKALEIMGQVIQTDIQRKIDNMKYPPLKAATIRRKGSSALLIDTGLLRSSIRYVVKNRDDADKAPAPAKAA
jgi:hypothetical protein